MVGVLSYLQWMLKTIQIKLIHILGGYTEEEYNTSFNDGYYIASKQITDTLKALTIVYYGCSKQEWINKIYSKIQEGLKGNVE